MLVSRASIETLGDIEVDNVDLARLYVVEGSFPLGRDYDLAVIHVLRYDLRHTCVSHESYVAHHMCDMLIV